MLHGYLMNSCPSPILMECNPTRQGTELPEFTEWLENNDKVSAKPSCGASGLNILFYYKMIE